jgi:hypothetical protein
MIGGAKQPDRTATVSADRTDAGHTDGSKGAGDVDRHTRQSVRTKSFSSLCTNLTSRSVTLMISARSVPCSQIAWFVSGDRGRVDMMMVVTDT